MNLLLRRGALTLLALAVLAAMIYAFLPRAVDVELAKVVRGDMQVTVDEDGKTRIQERYIVSAPLGGRLLRVELHPGDPVEAEHTVLTTIAPTDPALLDPRVLAQIEAQVKAAQAAVGRAEATLQQTREQLAFAETELGRARQLHERGAIPDEEFDEKSLLVKTRAQEYRAAEFAGEIARFELELAEAARLRTQPTTSAAGSDSWQFPIRSPINGRVLRVFQESATVVSAGDPLIELGDPTQLEVVVDVLSTDAVKIKPGAPVIIDHWGGPTTLRGSVQRVEPSAFTKVSSLGVEEQRVNVIVDFDDPWERRSTLADAYRVEAAFVVWSGQDVLKAPTSALFRQGADWAVFLVRDDRAHLQRVTLGQRNAQEAEVLAGLQAGDAVIVHPSDRVSDGARVRAAESPDG